VRIEPASAEGLANLGAALAGSGRLSEAIAQDRESLRLDPAHLNASANLGLALSAVQDGAGAEKAFERALALSPNPSALAKELRLHLDRQRGGALARRLAIKRLLEAARNARRAGKPASPAQRASS
jgi:tetratricopeptide (TPR) repeat protein